MIVSEVIGKRILAKIGGGLAGVEEYRILEQSPSGHWVKLMNIHGAKFWRTVGEVALVEVLDPLEPKPATREDPYRFGGPNYNHISTPDGV